LFLFISVKANKLAVFLEEKTRNAKLLFIKSFEKTKIGGKEIE